MRVVATPTGPLPPTADGDADARDATGLRRQLDAGLDLVTAGQSGRNSLLAEPLAASDATRVGDPEPYPYADRRYRPPVVTGSLRASGATAAAVDDAATALRGLDVDPAERLQATLPGPYTLADLARDDHYGDSAAFLDAVAGFLAAEARALPPVAAVALLEPRLVADPPRDGAGGRASAAVDAVAAAADAPVVVHCPGGALTPKAHAHLLDASVAAVGYDFTADHGANLSLVAEYGTADDAALGVVDARDPAVESAETVRDRLAWVLDSLPPAMDFDGVYATPGDALHHLPRAAAVEKIRTLADGVEVWRDD